MRKYLHLKKNTTMKRGFFLLTAPEELLSLRIHNLLMVQMGKTKYAIYCIKKKNHRCNTDKSTKVEYQLRKIMILGEKRLPTKGTLVY